MELPLFYGFITAPARLRVSSTFMARLTRGGAGLALSLAPPSAPGDPRPPSSTSGLASLGPLPFSSTDEPSESLHGCNEGWHARVSLDPTATALQPAGGGAIAATAAWVARMEQQSGYFGVGIVNGKSEANQGTLWRSAYQLGASFIFTVGARFDHRTDTVPAPPSHSGSSAAPPPAPSPSTTHLTGF